jgi:hypothetical protein
VATYVASATMVGGGVTAVVAEHWRCTIGVVCPTVMPTTRLPARQDHPTLEWEVASLSVSCSR